MALKNNNILCEFHTTDAHLTANYVLGEKVQRNRTLRVDKTRQHLQQNGDVLLLALLPLQRLLHVPRLLGASRAESGALGPVQVRLVVERFFQLAVGGAVARFACLQLHGALRASVVGEVSQAVEQQLDRAVLQSGGSQQQAVIRVERSRVEQLP